MSESKRREEKVITIGSATGYLKEFSGTLPEISEICQDEYRIGHTKNGASVKYEQTVTEVTDDLGEIKKTIVSDEKATMQLGLFGWNGNTLTKIISTAEITSESDGKRVTEIGGIMNDNRKRYVLCLYHHDEEDGDCWWMGVGKNTEGLELAYSQTDGTVAQPTFTCEPYNTSGRLLKYIEEIGEDGGSGGSGQQNAG